MRIADRRLSAREPFLRARSDELCRFRQTRRLPGLADGAAILDAVRGASVPIAGAIREGAGVDLVPLAWCFANPAGPVQDEAFERIAALICASLSRALDDGPLDGVYLDLHGAGVNDSFPDMEGELLRRVRAIVGPLPLAISLDPHANLTPRWSSAPTSWCRSAPTRMSTCAKPERWRCGCCANGSRAGRRRRARSASSISGSRCRRNARCWSRW